MDFKDLREQIVADARAKDGAPKWTLTDAVKNPALAWQILNLLVAKDENEALSIVGKNASTLRTNYSTIKKMGNINRTLSKFAEGDYDSDYSEFYKGLTDIMDTYAIKVLYDMYMEDDQIIVKAEELEKERAAAAKERMQKARQARKK